MDSSLRTRRLLQGVGIFSTLALLFGLAVVLFYNPANAGTASGSSAASLAGRRAPQPNPSYWAAGPGDPTGILYRRPRPAREDDDDKGSDKGKGKDKNKGKGKDKNNETGDDEAGASPSTQPSADPECTDGRGNRGKRSRSCPEPTQTQTLPTTCPDGSAGSSPCPIPTTPTESGCPTDAPHAVPCERTEPRDPAVRIPRDPVRLG